MGLRFAYFEAIGSKNRGLNKLNRVSGGYCSIFINYKGTRGHTISNSSDPYVTVYSRVVGLRVTGLRPSWL